MHNALKLAVTARLKFSIRIATNFKVFLSRSTMPYSLAKLILQMQLIFVLENSISNVVYYIIIIVTSASKSIPTIFFEKMMCGRYRRRERDNNNNIIVDSYIYMVILNRRIIIKR